MRLIRHPFILSCSVVILMYIPIFLRDRIPVHDGLQLATFVYYFFNHYIQDGELSLWWPQLMYGVDTNWYLSFTMTPSLWLLLPFAKWMGGISLLKVWYLSLLMDEALLLLGGYLLSRELFRHRLPALFVGLSLIGSSMWAGQPWYNFHLYYHLPLSFYFLWVGIRDNRSEHFLFSIAILAFGLFGNLQYLGFVQGLAWVVFAITAWFVLRGNVGTLVRQVNQRTALAGAVLLALMIVFLILTFYGTPHVNYNPGRDPENRVTAENFLGYAQFLDLAKYFEVFTGTSANIDMTAYAGVLVPIFLVYGLLSGLSRKQAPFVAVALFMVLLSLGGGSFVAPLAYYLPGAGYYRHVGFVMPVVKLMLIFLAGFGFDRMQTLFIGESVGGLQAKRSLRLLQRITLIFLGFCVLLVVTHFGLTMLGKLTGKMNGGFHSDILFQAQVPFRLNEPFEFFARALFTIFMYAASLGVLWYLRVNISKARAVLLGVGALVFVQGIDVLSYRSYMFEGRMQPVGREVMALFNPRPETYQPSRTLNYYNDAGFQLFVPLIGGKLTEQWFAGRSNEAHKLDQPVNNLGVLYNTLEPSILHLDVCTSIFRQDYWLSGVDKLIWSWMSTGLEDKIRYAPGKAAQDFYFPLNDVDIRGIIGCEQPKMRLFEAAGVYETDEDLVHDLREGAAVRIRKKDWTDYIGKADMPGWAKTGIVEGHVPKAAEVPGAQAEVSLFTANRIQFRLDIPERLPGAWLYYADAWHPFWKAYVNGNETRIFPANFAFKAVRVPAGMSEVVFEYDDTVLKITIIVLWSLMVLGMISVFWLAIRAVREG